MPAVRPRPALPDYLRPGLDVVFVGANPGLISAERGHYYAKKGNLFWPLLYEADLVPEPLTYEDDQRIRDFKIGLTDLVQRATAGVADLSRNELAAGARRLREKLRRVRPRVVCFNGKAIAEAFLKRRCALGLQPERWQGIPVFVMPSTSARAASYQRADKLRFFRELKRLVDNETSTGPARGQL